MAIIVLTVLFGAACGYFQYWMAVRLVKKRWLLLLQPGLLAGITACFAAWTLSIAQLKDSPARLAWAPFAALLLCAIGGWLMGEVRRRQKK